MFIKYLLQKLIHSNFKAIRPLLILKTQYAFSPKSVALLTGFSGMCICNYVFQFPQMFVPVKAKSAQNTNLCQAINDVSSSVVMVRGNIICSGIVISKDGLILTSSKAINKNSVDIEVLLSDKKSFNGKVIAVDDAKGLALIKIEITPGNELNRKLVFGDEDSASHGQWVFTISSPFYLTNSVSVGCITSIIRSDSSLQTDDLVYIDSDLNASNGSLGSPLCTFSGEVIGVITRLNTGHVLSMPIRHVVDFVNQYIILKQKKENSDSTPPNQANNQSGWFSGVSNWLYSSNESSDYLSNVILLELNDDIKKDFCLSNLAYRKLSHGVAVLDVAPNSKLFKHGLRNGDVILEANNELVFTRDDVARELHKSRVLLKVVRNHAYHVLKADYVFLQNN